TKIDDPFAERRCFDAKRHVLGINRTSGVIVPADAANAAGNEMGVARILVFHEHAVAPKYRGCAVAFPHLLVLEIDLRENAEAADDASDRIPVHFDEAFGLGEY